MKEVQFKNYYVRGVSTTKPLFNEALTKEDYVCKVEGDSVYLIPSSDYFGENRYNNSLIKRQLNGQIEDVINKGHSTRHKANTPMTFLDEVLAEATKKHEEGNYKFVNSHYRSILKEGLCQDMQKRAYQKYGKRLDREVSEKVGVANDQVASDYSKCGQGVKESQTTTTEGMVSRYGSLSNHGGIHNEEIRTQTNKGIKESQTVEKAPIFTYCKQMKNAIEQLALRSLMGHKRYEVGDDWENFARVPNGDMEFANAEFRHALEIGGEETQLEHLVASAWNAVSRLEIHLRNSVKK